MTASTRSLDVNQNLVGFEVYNVVQTTARSLITAINSTLEGFNSVFTDDAGLNYIMSLYNISDINNPNEVRAFLDSNKSLIPLVSEAYHRLQSYFPYGPIFAEVIEDELIISVGTALSPKEAKYKLYEFDNEWWLDIDSGLRSKLCITVEFQ